MSSYLAHLPVALLGLFAVQLTALFFRARRPFYLAAVALTGIALYESDLVLAVGEIVLTVVLVRVFPRI